MINVLNLVSRRGSIPISCIISYIRALFGNRRSAGASILGGAGGGMLGDGST